MNVLVACEESQRVTIEFRKQGHNAFSCDILEPSGGHEEWHIQGDVLPLLNGDCVVKTMDGTEHEIAGRWDMIIAFPPCTHLCSSGQRWFAEGKKPRGLQYDAINFFMQFVNADCEKKSIENPVGIMSTRFRKPDQIINPWQFGEKENKRTCLWLKGLPRLQPTDIIPHEERTTNIHKGVFDGKHYRWSDPAIKKLRSKTFPGVAKAMAEQWGGERR